MSAGERLIKELRIFPQGMLPVGQMELWEREMIERIDRIIEEERMRAIEAQMEFYRAQIC